MNQEISAPNFREFSVLLVEDDFLNRQVVQGFLSDTHVNVICAENGLIAIEKLQEEAFDLVLMDIQMPEMDGLAASRYIRDKLEMPMLPIVAMTAHAMEEDVEKSIVAGMNQHLTKPIDPTLLFQTLAKYFTKAQEKQAEMLEEQLSDEYELLQQIQDKTSLQVNDAISRLKNKKTLYVQLVKDFWTKYQQLADDMKFSYETRAFEELYRSAHSLKSTAQYIGADELSQAAGQLELDLTQEHDNVITTLNDVRAKLTFVIAQLNHVFYFENEGLATETLDVVHAIKLIEKLKPMINSSNIMAEHYSIALRKLAEQTSWYKKINELHTFISDFSFAEAQVLLTEIEDKMKS